ARLDKLLEESDSAVRNKLWKTSANALKAAQDLPLEPEQVERVSAASDARAAAMEAERARLLKLLEDCVKRGAEAEGEKIIEKILELSPTTGDQVKLRKLREELKGETEADRLKRLPRHLNHQWDDRYCKAEQLFDVGEEVSALGVTDDGKFACVGTASGKVTVFNLRR